MPEPLEIIAYSDFLCPWCYNFTVRMRRLEAEFGDRIQIHWHTYLLRPEPRGKRDPERFREYTRGWQRPAQEEDAGNFRTWTGENPPPSHSIPPHIVAKAAENVGPTQARKVHDGLLVAYFSQSRDISNPEVLQKIWSDAGLTDEQFPNLADPAAIKAIETEHADAVALGLTGVPAARLAKNPAFVTGALPYAMYHRWVERHLV